MDEKAIYQRLRERLDEIGFGYAPTETGVEYVFLERFFTPEQAKLFCEVPLYGYFTAAEVADSIGCDANEVSKALRDMSKSGLLYRKYDEQGIAQYHAIPVAHGIYEFHVNQVESEWASAMSQHYLQGWGKTYYATETPIFRSLPMSPDVVAEGALRKEDDYRHIIENARRWAVTDCMCRKREELRGKPCKHPMEACLVFDGFADYYLENEIAREITKEEALDIVKQSVKSGCVIHVSNGKNPEALCNCCSCACGLLGALKYFPGPANKNVSNYVCVRDEQKCIEGKCHHNCAKTCPVRAFRSKDGVLSYNPDSCIGCGNCVTRCPGHALELVIKPEEQLVHLPENLFDTYAQISTERGFDVRNLMLT